MKVRLRSTHYFDELNLTLDEGTIIEAAIPKKDKDGKVVYIVTGNAGSGRVRKPVIEKMGKVILVRPIKDPQEKFNPIAPNPPSMKEIPTTWIGPPSIEMEPLDEEAEKACAQRAETYMSINDLPITPAQAKPNAA